MITELDTNLLTFDKVNAFAHQANCFHTMGSGIAAQIKITYPELYAADVAHGKRGDRSRLGKFSFVKCHDGKVGYNVYGQYDFGRQGRPTRYDALYDGLFAVEKHVQTQGVTTLGLPKNIGCALGGGSWTVVRAIIEDIFANSPVHLYICNYTPAQQPDSITTPATVPLIPAHDWA